MSSRKSVSDLLQIWSTYSDDEEYVPADITDEESVSSISPSHTHALVDNEQELRNQLTGAANVQPVEAPDVANVGASSDALHRLIDDEMSDLDGENDPDFYFISEDSGSESGFKIPRRNLCKELALLKEEATHPLTFSRCEARRRSASHVSIGEKLVLGSRNMSQFLEDCSLPFSIKNLKALLNNLVYVHSTFSCSRSRFFACFTGRQIITLKAQLDLFYQLLLMAIGISFSMKGDSHQEKRGQDELKDLLKLLEHSLTLRKLMIKLISEHGKEIEELEEPSSEAVGSTELQPKHSSETKKTQNESWVSPHILPGEEPRVCLLDVPILRRLCASPSLLMNLSRESSKHEDYQILEARLQEWVPFVDTFFLLKTKPHKLNTTSNCVVFTPAEDRLLGVGLEIYGRNYFSIIRRQYLPHRSEAEIFKRFKTLQKMWQTHKSQANSLSTWRRNLEAPFSEREDLMLIRHSPVESDPLYSTWRNFGNIHHLNRDISSLVDRLWHLQHVMPRILPPLLLPERFRRSKKRRKGFSSSQVDNHKVQDFPNLEDAIPTSSSSLRRFSPQGGNEDEEKKENIPSNFHRNEGWKNEGGGGGEIDGSKGRNWNVMRGVNSSSNIKVSLPLEDVNHSNGLCLEEELHRKVKSERKCEQLAKIFKRYTPSGSSLKRHQSSGILKTLSQQFNGGNGKMLRGVKFYRAVSSVASELDSLPYDFLRGSVNLKVPGDIAFEPLALAVVNLQTGLSNCVRRGESLRLGQRMIRPTWKRPEDA